MGRPFPLRKGWFTPAIRAQLEAQGLLAEYRDYLYDLPDGVEADDGTLVLGASADHRGLLLVTSGPAAGQVWLDNRGNDHEEVLPSGQTFVEMVRTYLEGTLARLEARARFDALVAQGRLDALREAFGDELDQRFREVLSARAAAEAPEPISPDLARLMADHFADAYGSAGQALALGSCWAELEARCLRDWAAYEAGHMGSDLLAEVTLQAHLAVAQVALGRPGPIHDYRVVGSYWHRSPAVVPRVLSRWGDQAQVHAVFERLRTDVALEFLSCFPAAALAHRLRWVRELANRWLDALADGSYPAGLRTEMGSSVSKVLQALLALLDRDESGDLPPALESWFGLAGCTCSTKTYRALLEAAGARYTPLHATREEARAALPQRSASRPRP
jgi:hypothetical protein